MARPWKSDKSSSKGKAAAQRAVVGGGVAAAVLALIRKLWPEALPWDTQFDTALVAVLASVWAWVRTYFVDKFQHGGGKNLFAALAKPKQPPAPKAVAK